MSGQPENQASSAADGVGPTGQSSSDSAVVDASLGDVAVLSSAADDQASGASPEFLEAPVRKDSDLEETKEDQQLVEQSNYGRNNEDGADDAAGLADELYVALFNDPSFLDDSETEYGDNIIKTSKYTPITFLPLNLFEQFHRIANMYFLMIIAIQSIPGLAPFNVWTSVMPLIFILSVSAIKDGIEDWGRHEEDRKANSISVHKLDRDSGVPEFRDIASAEVRVGDLIRVDRGEEIPADCIALSSSNEDGSLYISTASMDGENAPKLRRSVKLTAHVKRPQDFIALRGRIETSPNVKALHGFTGKMALSQRSLPVMTKKKSARIKGQRARGIRNTSGDSDEDLDAETGEYLLAQTKEASDGSAAAKGGSDATGPSVNADGSGSGSGSGSTSGSSAMSAAASPLAGGSGDDDVLSALGDEQFLFRGAKVVNTECVYAFVLYVGDQSKLMLNRNEVPFKFSRFESILNKCIAIILVLNFLGCFLLGLGATLVTQPFSDLKRPAIRSFFMDSASWIVLTSWMIPFSLYVTMELVKLVQSQWVAWDNEMVFYYGSDPEAIRIYMDREIEEMELRKQGLLDSQGWWTYCCGCLNNYSRSDSNSANVNSTHGDPVPRDSEAVHPSLVAAQRVNASQMSLAEEFEGIVEKRTARVKNSNLNEELGHIDYIFTDKTGTLTQNLMELHKCSIVGRKYQNDVRSSASASANAKVKIPEDYTSLSSLIRTVFDRESEKAASSMDVGSGGVMSGSSLRSSGLGSGSVVSAVPSSLPSTAKTMADCDNQRDSHFIWNLILCSAALPVPKPKKTRYMIDGDDNDDNDHHHHSGGVGGLNSGVQGASSSSRISQEEPVREHSPDMGNNYGSIEPLKQQSNQGGIEIEFMSPSPDEVAFAEALADQGIVLEDRSASQTISVRMHPTAKHVRRKGMGENSVMRSFNVVATLNFTSSRKRMTVVVRDEQTGEVFLYSKGADSTILSMCRSDDEELINKTAKHVDTFAKMGSRTLVLAVRPLPPSLFEEFEREFKRAELALSNRENKIERAFQMIEKDLLLCGCTAVEDQMQEGVAQCVDKLKEAKIKVVMLTGDKEETAVSIGRQSHIIGESLADSDLIFMSAIHHTNESMMNQEIERLMGQINNILATRKSHGYSSGSSSLSSNDRRSRTTPSVLDLMKNGDESSLASDTKEVALVINGDALELCLQDFLVDKFLDLFGIVDTVVCNRANPFQKALMVSIIKREMDGVALAIGDGANDVSMIQAANVGIGIMGKEGTQAALAADFVIHRFRHLSRLLFVHGRFCFLRTSLVALLSLYKNMAFNMPLVYFAFFSLFTAQTMFDPNMMASFNITFTSLFPLMVGAFEQDMDDDTAMAHPLAYAFFKTDSQFSLAQFGLWMVTALWQSLVLFFVFYLSSLESHDIWDESGKQGGIWAWGTSMLIATVVMINLKMMAETKQWNVTYYVSTALGQAAFFSTLAIICNWQDLGMDMWKVMDWIFNKPMFWLINLLAVSLCLIPGLLYNLYNREYSATLANVLLEAQKFGYLKFNGQDRPTKDIIYDYLHR